MYFSFHLIMFYVFSSKMGDYETVTYGMVKKINKQLKVEGNLPLVFCLIHSRKNLELPTFDFFIKHVLCYKGCLGSPR